LIKRLLTAIFYRMNIAWITLLMFFVASRDVKGRDNVPRKGPLILVSNHLNNADPPVVTVNVPRQVSWLTKSEWFSTPVIGGMFRMAGMIPVRRFDADLHALREVQGLLKGGGCLGMFPEGTRSKDKVLHRGELGTALIALRSGSAIQPAAVWGTEDVKLPLALLKRTRVHVRFGRPFKLDGSTRPNREEVSAGTDRIMREIAALLPEKYRGAYAEATPESASSQIKANP